MKKILLLLPLMIAIITGGCADSRPLATSQKTPNSNITQPNQIAKTTPDLSEFPEDHKDSLGNIYAVQFYDTTGERVNFSSLTTNSGTEYPTSKLVKIDPTTNSTTVLVSDLTANAQKIVPTIPKAYSFFIFSITSDGHNIFLREDQGFDGFNVPRPLWRFNTQTNKLTFLKNVSSYTGSPFYTQLSPDKQTLISAPDNDSADKTCLGDSRHLYLLNMLNDTVKLIASLPTEQTLNARYCGYSGGGFEIEWINNATIKYTIFDQSKADKDYENNTTIQNKPAIISKIITL